MGLRLLYFNILWVFLHFLNFGKDLFAKIWKIFKNSARLGHFGVMSDPQEPLLFSIFFHLNERRYMGTSLKKILGMFRHWLLKPMRQSVQIYFLKILFSQYIFKRRSRPGAGRQIFDPWFIAHISCIYCVKIWQKSVKP